MKNFYQKGMSLIEILVVVAIIGILIAIVLPQFSKSRENQILKNTLGDVVSSIHNAQTQSLASINSSEYGVHFQADKIVIFKGKVYSAVAADNKTINIISPATISNVTLTGVSATSGDIYFERLSGVSNKAGTVTISISSSTKIITISATGIVSVN